MTVVYAARGDSAMKQRSEGSKGCECGEGNECSEVRLCRGSSAVCAVMHAVAMTTL